MTDMITIGKRIEFIAILNAMINHLQTENQIIGTYQKLEKKYPIEGTTNMYYIVDTVNYNEILKNCHKIMNFKQILEELMDFTITKTIKYYVDNLNEFHNYFIFAIKVDDYDILRAQEKLIPF